MYYIDESGSIPKFVSRKWKNRFFVIAFVHTNNPDHLKKVYKNGLRNVRKYYPQYFERTGELKGSFAPPFVKEYLLRRLIEKTDISIGYMLVDNWNIREKFRQDASRSFNFFSQACFDES